ncbi:MAG TPA: FAD-binding protein [Ilumatobacter sp.]|nr:FAD-binding protein [Ilumatobacter sp.]
MDLTVVETMQELHEFAEEVGREGEVTVAGMATRGGPVDDVRTVMAPAGIYDVQPDEMTVRCGAGTPVEMIDEALARFGQSVAVPPVGTIGGALAVADSGIRRLRYGPIRDTVLQVRYVNASGELVKAGGPTVKNVSGFDLCRLMVGAHGTLGFLAEVILRTRPRASFEQWFVSLEPPDRLQALLYRPTSMLWDGESVWVLLEGHPDDVRSQAENAKLVPGDPPELPRGGRWSLPPSALANLAGTGRFVAEIGVGVVHHEESAPPRVVDPVVADLHRRIKHEFDPNGRFNPGIDVLTLR